MTTRPALSPSSARVLAAIEAFWAEHGYSPSVQDVATAANFSKSNTWAHVRKLRNAGRITFDDGISRSIVLVKEAAHDHP